MHNVAYCDAYAVPNLLCVQLFQWVTDSNCEGSVYFDVFDKNTSLFNADCKKLLNNIFIN